MWQPEHPPSQTVPIFFFEVITKPLSPPRCVPFGDRLASHQDAKNGKNSVFQPKSIFDAFALCPWTSLFWFDF
jgi:hypothetical protein